MSPLPPTRERPIVTRNGPGSPNGGTSPGQSVPPGRGRRWMRRIGIVVVVLLAVMLGAAAAVTFLAKQEIDDLVQAETAAERATQKQLTPALPGKPTNILVLGSDHRAGFDESDRRSDTLLLVRLDPRGKTISMLSFPRDLYVSIPGHGQAKINEAYSLGGPALSVQTIKQVTGLDVNFVMDVDFQGFRGVVDAFGGIWVDVDQHYFTPPEADYMEIDVQAGYQNLGGRDALAFARYRHGDSDFHRIARQQLVLSGLKKQISASSKFNSIPALFRVMSKNTSIVGGGGDGVPARVLYDYVRLATGINSKDIYQIEFEGGIGTAGEASIVTYEQAKLEAAVNAFLRPSASARERTADQLVGKVPDEVTATGDSVKASEAAAPPPTPNPSTVSVKVLNGSGTAGVARTMAGALRSAGYQVDPNQTNADNANYANTRVQYASVSGKPAADALADRIAGATAEAKGTGNTFTTQLLVIVGKTGRELSADAGSTVGTDDGPSGGETAEGNKVPVKASARVITDAEYGRDDFGQVGRMPFPLLYPTVREQGSTYEEVRAYQIAKGKSAYSAYRMVAQTASGDYWGLQGTNWPDPPILEGATREVSRSGRRYKLFFNGTKLHMVAWRQGTGTYWVSNSVLNKLNNETLLAIADGVKPFS